MERHLTQTHAVEARISQRTAMRSELFKLLEDELNKLTTAPLTEIVPLEPDEKGSPNSSAQHSLPDASGRMLADSFHSKTETASTYANAGGKSCEKLESDRLVPDTTKEDEDEEGDRYEDEFDKHPLESTDDNEIEFGAASLDSAVPMTKTHQQVICVPDASEVLRSPGETLAKLRADAANIDEVLQADRLLLNMLRSAHTNNLTRLERLEMETCKYSEQWELEEQTRLSADIELSKSMIKKRKRDIQDDGASLQHNKSRKVMLRAVEALLILGVGVSLASVKQTYFQ